MLVHRAPLRMQTLVSRVTSLKAWVRRHFEKIRAGLRRSLTCLCGHSCRSSWCAPIERRCQMWCPSDSCDPLLRSGFILDRIPRCGISFYKQIGLAIPRGRGTGGVQCDRRIEGGLALSLAFSSLLHAGATTRRWTSRTAVARPDIPDRAAATLVPAAMRRRAERVARRTDRRPRGRAAMRV